MSEVMPKVILIGDAAVGKTCFLNRFLHPEMQFNQIYNQTIPAAFVTYTVTINEQEYTIQIWDTAGSDRVRGLQPMYCRNSQAAFIVCSYDQKDSLENLEMWKNIVLNNVPECKCYFILNKSDLAGTDKSQFDNSHFEDYCKERGFEHFIEVSALTGNNGKEVFNQVIHEICTQRVNLPEIHELPTPQPIQLTNQSPPQKKSWYQKCC